MIFFFEILYRIDSMLIYMIFTFFLQGLKKAVSVRMKFYGVSIWSNLSSKKCLKSLSLNFTNIFLRMGPCWKYHLRLSHFYNIWWFICFSLSFYRVWKVQWVSEWNSMVFQFVLSTLIYVLTTIYYRFESRNTTQLLKLTITLKRTHQKYSTMSK